MFSSLTVISLAVALFVVPLVSAAGNATLDSTSASQIPTCASKCLSVKLTEAASWFGAGDITSYCKHSEFLLAYNTCLKDHCQGADLTLGEQAGAAACAGVTPQPPATGTTGANGTEPSMNGTDHGSTNDTEHGSSNGTEYGSEGSANGTHHVPTVTTATSTPTGTPVLTSSASSGVRTGSAAAVTGTASARLSSIVASASASASASSSGNALSVDHLVPLTALAGCALAGLMLVLA